MTIEPTRSNPAVLARPDEQDPVDPDVVADESVAVDHGAARVPNRSDDDDVLAIRRDLDPLRLAALEGRRLDRRVRGLADVAHLGRAEGDRPARRQRVDLEPDPARPGQAPDVESVRGVVPESHVLADPALVLRHGRVETKRVAGDVV